MILNNVQVARLLFTSPTQAFTELKQRPVFALPMWLTLLGIVLVTSWYYSKVDIEWLTDQMLATSRLPADQQQLMAARMTRPVLLWSSVIAAPLVIAILVSISALYFLLVGKIANLGYSFRHWFAFNWWAGSPQIVACVASLLILAFSGTQIHASSLAPLSLNELVFHRSMGAPGYNFLSSIGLIQLATAWLSYVGLRAWSGRSPLFCLVVALLPMVLIYGIWGLFAFR